MLALPVYLVGVSSNNKLYTILAAIVMSIVAANTGSSNYLPIDLIGIGFAVYIAFQNMKKEEK